MKESAECYESLAEADPSFVEAWSGGAGVRHLDGDYEKAVSMYRSALALRPDDQTSKHLLSAILGGGEGAGDTPQAAVAPEEYVRGIFDGYAGTFEESLAVLRYQCPRPCLLQDGCSALGTSISKPFANHRCSHVPVAHTRAPITGCQGAYPMNLCAILGNGCQVPIAGTHTKSAG